MIPLTTLSKQSRKSTGIVAETARTESNSLAYLSEIQDKRSGLDRRLIKINGLGKFYYTDRRSQTDRRVCIERRNNFQPKSMRAEPYQSFLIDERNKCLFVNGQKINLTPKEFGLILLLSTDMDRVFTTEEIIEHLWPANGRANKSDLYQYMHLLRKKIEPDPASPQLLRNVKGFGYKLDINQ